MRSWIASNTFTAATKMDRHKKGGQHDQWINWALLAGWPGLRLPVNALRGQFAAVSLFATPIVLRSPVALTSYTFMFHVSAITVSTR